MITPELVGYIRAEFAKGKTREEIHTELVIHGGWTEEDMNEAFRVVVPMQGLSQSPSQQRIKSKSFWRNCVLVVAGILCIVLVYVYQSSIVSFWDSSIQGLRGFVSSFSLSSFNINKIIGLNNEIVKPTQEPAPVTPAPIVSNTAPPATPIGSEVVVKNPVPKNCGVGATPDLSNPQSYRSSAVLNCLGAEAERCVDGTNAILIDPIFPTIFQITNDKGACNFTLSYAKDSKLTDVNGNKLAGQSITCPLSIVKSLDESKTPPVFNAPSINDPNKYASEIYFYGTLGVFTQNNVDKSKILRAGCSGSFIDSVIASYQKMQSEQ